ncbi:MAG TPA: iron ABC transporter permease [Alphaproteobacteria bacterium]|jgi:iron(III) transport system permease protein
MVDVPAAGGLRVGARPSRAGLDRRVLLGAALLLVIGAVTLAPVLYVLIASFDVSSIGEPFKFGWKGWQDVFSSTRTLDAIGYSFLLSARVPIAVIVAFTIAWLLVRVEVPGRRFIELALWFGFFLPSVPMMMGWILLLDANYGLLNAAAMKLPFVTGPIFSIYSIPGIMWVHLSLTTIPVMVILLTPALRQLDAAYEEAADMSGAGTWMTLRRITVPLVAPAILTAFVASLIRSLETFEVEQILGTPAKIYVYATRIYDLINWEPPLFSQAMALSALFLAILFVLAFFYQRYLRRAGERPTVMGRDVKLRARPKTAWVYVISFVLIAYIAVSILLPLAVLIVGSFTKLFGFFFLEDAWTAGHWREVLTDDRFLRATLNSLALGLTVGCIGTLLFALVAWCLVRGKVWGGNVISILVWLPWAIPGLVLGVTLLSLLLNVPLISGLYGTIVPLIMALIIKELPIGVQLLRTSLSQISGQLEEAASMSGAGFAYIFRRVTLPLIAPMLVSVFLLVFAGTIRDISTIVLIATPGMRTLSLLMFDFAASGRFESAAVIGIIIAVISLAMTAFAFRMGERFGVKRK